jgi:hypothetical protein
MLQTTHSAPTAPSTPPAAPLLILAAPLPGDLHLTVYAAPDAALGHIDLTLCAGRGSRGRGQRALDDARFFARTLRRLAAHIATYADAYEAAANEDA